MTLDTVWGGPQGAPVVVLVHGLGGSHRTWTSVAPLLSGDFRVAAVDLPGGRAIEREADDLWHTLTQAQVEAATVVGHSMGGLVATALAERAPGLVGRLVLVNTPPTVESRLSARSMSERMLRLPLIGTVIWAVLGTKQLRAGLRSAVAPGSEVPEQLLDDLRATSHQAFVGSTTAIDGYLTQRALAPRLHALGVPVEVVFGLEDRRVAPASLRVYDALPNVRVTRVAGVGHTPPLETPRAVSAAVARIYRTPGCFAVDNACHQSVA